MTNIIADVREYHQATKHSVASVRSTSHRLDWSNQPRPYKRYLRPEQLPLPRDASAGGSLDAALVSTLFQLSVGITKWLRLADGRRMAFRAAACTGALYHIDLYLVCQDLPGVPQGVYHFDVENVALTRLRSGDFRGVLDGATAGNLNRAPAVLIATSTFWRNSWKYQARTYRHAFWDSGTVLANLLAVAGAHHLPVRVLSAFVDAAVNQLLDVDPEREAALVLVPIGEGGSAPPPVPAIARLDLPTEPYSFSEVDEPLIRQAHRLTSLATPEEVAAQRRDHPAENHEEAAIEDVIRRRGSARHFDGAPIERAALDLIVASANRPIPADFPRFSELYLIENDEQSRDIAGHLALDQTLAAEAAVNIYLLEELPGGRDYRAGSLDAAIRAGRVYLAAYAAGLAATGLTFYDDEVRAFFGTDKEVFFLMAVGRRLMIAR